MCKGLEKFIMITERSKNRLASTNAIHEIPDSKTTKYQNKVCDHSLNVSFHLNSPENQVNVKWKSAEVKHDYICLTIIKS
jgi:hypothetical protein